MVYSFFLKIKLKILEQKFYFLGQAKNFQARQNFQRMTGKPFLLEKYARIRKF